MVPLRSHVDVAGQALAVYEWPGEDPPVLLVHAAGFHSRCWDLVVAGLPGRRCVAFDFPGHGRSAKPREPWSWPALADLVVAVARELRLDGAIAVGHSMGGYAVTLAALLDPALFGGLVLVDPVILPPDRIPGGGRGAEGAMRRRSEFSSVDEMVERFRERHPFDRWLPQALRDYCEHGLLPAPGGEGFVLACEPELEAEVYRTVERLDRDLSAVTIPVHILRARTQLPDGGRDMTCSPADPALATRFPSAVDQFLPELGHHLPMEAPGVVAGAILGMLPRK